MKTNKDMRRIRLDALKPHPLQEAYFGDMSDAELTVLANSIRANGCEPIEVLPDFTIVSGHQRRRALKLLGEVKADVIVRGDLTEEEATTYFIMSNLARRHLDVLALIRAYLKLRSIGDWKSRALNRDALAQQLKRLGVSLSGRMLDRYIRVTRLPRPIQDAISSKHISLLDATRLINAKQTTIDSVCAAVVRGEGKAELKALMRNNRPESAVQVQFRTARKALINAAARLLAHSLAPADKRAIRAVLARLGKYA